MVDESITQIRIALLIIFKSVGLALLLGFLYIIRSLASSAAERRKNLRGDGKTFNRLLLALSISDVVVSLMFFIGTWVVPKYDAEQPWTKGHRYAEDEFYAIFPYASGNDVTCSAQGFLILLGQNAAICLTGSISIQYVLTVRFEWREAAMVKVEKILLCWSFVYPLVFATTALSLDVIGVKYSGWCWLSGGKDIFVYAGTSVFVVTLGLHP